MALQLKFRVSGALIAELIVYIGVCIGITIMY